jgi:hypothetical protein
MRACPAGASAPGPYGKRRVIGRGPRDGEAGAIGAAILGVAGARSGEQPTP